LEDVPWADWDQSNQLAVIHNEKGHYRVEYPIGRVLYQSAGWISGLRFSPKGDRIAFIDHPALWDDRGSICLVDLSGSARTLSSGWESALGLAWNHNGDEVWFTAAQNGSDRALFAVNLSGKVRSLLHVPGGLTLQDVAPDGRVLLTFNAERLAMAATTRGSNTVVDLSWRDWSIAKDISKDGQWVLFEDASEAAGPHYTVNLRKLDGSLPQRLGEGSAGGLSPDGKWVISVSTDKPEVALLPVGPGQPRTIPVAGLEKIQNGSARFLADGHHFIVNGSEPKHSTRCYLVDMNGGVPQPITPEGILGGRVSPDGRYVYPLIPYGPTVIYPLNGGSPVSIPGLEANFRPSQWSADSSSLYGYVNGEVPAKVYAVNIATGKKTFLQALSPVNPTGVVYIAPVIVSETGTRFAFSYSEIRSELYLVTGLR
jgi:Tol biopolymer transport system component